MTNDNNLTAEYFTPDPAYGLPGALLVRPSCGEPDYQTWLRFINDGHADPGLDSVLLNSWRRCNELGVDPIADEQSVIQPSPDSQFDIDLIRDLAARLDKRLTASIKDRGQILAITDATGRFVYRDGSKDILSLTERIGLNINADWTEKSVGTNAIGTALAEGFPVQIFGCEHFKFSHQIFKCTAAPFFAPSGQIMGCVDFSSGLDTDHSQNLNLAIGLSRFFERALLQAYAQEMQSWPQIILEQANLRSGSTGGVLAVEAGGRICGADEEALSILSLRAASLVGRQADEIFDLGPLKKSMADQNFRDQTLVLSTLSTPVLTAQCKHLWSPSGLWLGFLLFLQIPMAPRVTLGELERVQTETVCTILGTSQSTQEINQQCAAFAMTPSTILITGESGTGKELVAHALHALGPRRKAPFIAVNCGALPDELIQSELFGYAPGAFTGANRKGRSGLFEESDGGVLFLDEIGELPLRHQANLLRVLEDSQVMRIGSAKPHHINVKIVAATNKDLASEVEDGRFREDLFHRLAVMVIALTPLRERPQDILPIARYHLKQLVSAMKLPPLTMSKQTEELLLNHPWPGNVRALVNAMEFACNQYFIEPFHKMEPRHLPQNLTASPSSSVHDLDKLESTEIRRALNNFKGNISQAAKALGIGRNTLYAKIKKWNISK